MKSSEGIRFGGLWRRKLEGRSCFANWSAGGLVYGVWTYRHSHHRLKSLIRCAPLMLLQQCEYHRIIQNHSTLCSFCMSLYVFVALPSHLLLWFRGSHRTQQLPLPFRSFQNRWWRRSLKSHSTSKWIRAISCHKKRFLQATKCTTKIHQHSSTFIDSNILWLKLWLSSLPHPNPTIKNDKARLRAELYAARDEVRSLQRDLGSRFCRARHGCRTDINSLAAWCGETTWQIVTVNMFLMFLMFSHLGWMIPRDLSFWDALTHVETNEFIGGWTGSFPWTFQRACPRRAWGLQSWMSRSSAIPSWEGGII